MRVLRTSVSIVALSLATITLGACSDNNESAKASDAASAQVDESLVPTSFPMPEGATWTDAYTIEGEDGERVLATATVQMGPDEAVTYFEQNLEDAGYEILETNGQTVAFEDENGNPGTVQAAIGQDTVTTVYVTVNR